MSPNSQKLVNVGNAMFIKPVIAGAIAGAGEKFIMKGSNTTALYFAGAVAGGIAVSGTIGKLLEPAVPTATSIGSMLGKSLEHRIIEVTCGTSVAFAVNKFILKNEWRTDMHDVMIRVAIISVADVLSEFIVDSMSSNPNWSD